MSLFDKTEKPIGLASDHAGFAAKQIVIKLLTEKGIPFKDFGAYSEESSDYADFAHPWQQPLRTENVILELLLVDRGTV